MRKGVNGGLLWFATGQDKNDADQETCRAVEQRPELGTSYGGEQGRVCAQEKHPYETEAVSFPY